MRQTAFPFMKSYKKSFGGSDLVGRRKSKRPLSTKSPIHLILKSDTHRVFRPCNQSLRDLIYRTAAKFNVQIRESALNWTHIHFVIQIHNRNEYVRFIRALTSKLSMAVIKAKATAVAKSATINKSEKLFTLRPFTRIITWGRDYKMTVQYIFLNFIESLGIKRQKSWSKIKQKISRGRTNAPSSLS